MHRRKFLKRVGKLSSAGFLASTPIAAAAEYISKQSFTISILQTTDVHCQVHTHDELFWEDEKAVFRQTGGYSRLATYFKQEKKRNPFSFIIDTGDMFQGSELSVKTTGQALVPILNTLGYDLYLPG